MDERLKEKITVRKLDKDIMKLEKEIIEQKKKIFNSFGLYVLIGLFIICSTIIISNAIGCYNG